MQRWRHAALAALLLSAAIGGPAHAADPADIAYWTSVQNSGNPDELRAYLHAFPHGEFAGLAQVKLNELQGTPQAAQPQGNRAPASGATIELTRPVVRAIDWIELDVDASALQHGSNFRVFVFRAGSPDRIVDPNFFAFAATTVTPEMQHLTIPPGLVGNDEVRLLYIPQFGNSYVVAARAPVKVLPGSPGAVIAGELTAEAKYLGPVRFEAKYRDRAIKVEGQFLRVQAETSGTDWNAILQGKYSEPQNIAAISIGALGTEADAGGPTEILCLLPADNRQILDRVAAMNPGDDVVIAGSPTNWTSAFGGSAVALDHCQFAR
jgi:hypothetical protein